MWLFLSQCANPVSLTGGPRDEQEPSVDTLLSTPNLQTNFEIQEIELYFDEFVDLKDQFNNIVISPPLKKNPKITARGKKVNIQFDEEEVLKDDATYVINFGEAIRDFTESNILKNYRYVFSTGDYIDSLSVSGTVVDAKSGKPVEDMYVMLYDNLADTVVRTQRPFYFSSTDKEGNYTIENLRADTFKIFALKDANLNYMYDQDSEAIGFLEEFVVVKDDSLPQVYDLETFIETTDFALKEKVIKNFGAISLLFTEEPSTVEYKASIEGLKFTEEVLGDSLLLWYDSPVDTSFNLIVHHKGYEYHDTVSVRKYNRSDFVNKGKLQIRSNTLASGNKLVPTEPLKFKFNYPVSTFIKDSIKLLMDSVELDFEIAKDSLDARSLLVNSTWQADSAYQIVFRSGSVTDMYGHKVDSTAQKFTVINPSILSRIAVIYTELDSTSAYVITLRSGTTIIKEDYITGSSNGKVLFTGLIPKAYNMEVIKDENANKRWDPGNYDNKKQSESIYTKELEELRENWDLEVTLTAADFIKKVVQDTVQ